MIISSSLLADVSDLQLELLVDRYDNVLRDTMDVLAPLLKKPNADCEKFSNFRPVSNLKFLSKL